MEERDMGAAQLDDEVSYADSDEFYDFNSDREMWAMPCCGADYDCICP